MFRSSTRISQCSLYVFAFISLLFSLDTLANSIRIEAEAGQLFGAFEVFNDSTASGGQAVRVANTVDIPDAQRPNNRVDFLVNITQPGRYRVETRVRGIDGLQDSFFAGVGNDFSSAFRWNIPVNSNFRTDNIAGSGQDPFLFDLSAGTHTLSVYVRDEGSELDSIEFILVEATGDAVAPPIDSPNTAPVITAIANQSDIAGESVNLQVIASDVDNDTLTYSATGLPQQLSIDAGTGQITGTVTEAGAYDVTVTVNDNNGGTDSTTFTWTVTAQAVTPPPPPSDSLSIEAEAGELFGRFAVGDDNAASGGQYVHVPSGAGGSETSLSDRVEYRFNVTQPGRYRIDANVYAVDGSDDSFYVRVNGLPEIGYRWHIRRNTSYQIDSVADRNPTPVLDPVIVELTAGIYTVAVYLRETRARLDRIELVLVEATGDAVAPPIDSPNTAPVITAIANQSDIAGESVNLQVIASDVDNDTLTYSATGLPQQLSIDAGTGQITGTVTEAGAYDVTVTVNDNNGGTDSTTFTWTVTAQAVTPPPPPSDSLSLEAEEGQLFGAFEVFSDSAASGGQAVRVPVTVDIPDTQRPNNRVDFSVNISQPGLYRVETRVRGFDGIRDSFFAGIGNDFNSAFRWNIPRNANFRTDNIAGNGQDPFLFELGSGIHTLSIYVREEGAELDRIEFILVEATDTPPVDTSPPTTNQLSNIDLSIELDQDFDPNIFEYTASVGFLQTSFTLTATSNVTAITANGQLLVAGQPINIALDEGSNTIELVESENGVDITYSIVITRGSADTFAQQAYLKASNAASGDKFGSSLALSGNTLVVGAQFADERFLTRQLQGSGDDFTLEAAGVVHVFVQDRLTQQWSQQALIAPSISDVADRFGSSISLSGDTLVVGAPSEDSALNSDGRVNPADNSARESGAVFVFTRNSEGVWIEQTMLKASNTDQDDRFGKSVSLSGDTLVVSADREDSALTANGSVNPDDNSARESGAVYVFERNLAGVWTEQAFLKASNADQFDNFGRSVSLSGDTLVVSAVFEASALNTDGSVNPSDNSAFLAGAVYVFERDATGSWIEQAFLKASNTEGGDRFGGSVSLSGETLAVSASSEASALNTDGSVNPGDNSASASGAVYVFERDATGSWIEQAFLKASNAGASDLFGGMISLSGDVLVVGASGEDSKRNADGTIDFQQNLAFDSGAAYVFIRNPTTGAWVEHKILKASNAESSDDFGSDVLVVNDTIIVSANSEAGNSTGGQLNNDAPFSGATYIFNDARLTNAAPVAFDTAAFSSNLTGRLFATDIDGDSLTFSQVGIAVGGTVNIDSAAGTFVFIPGADFSGNASFDFVVNDGVVNSEVETISIFIRENSAPLAKDLNLLVTADNTVNGVLDARDTDGDTLTYRVIDQPVNGSVVIIDQLNGVYEYTNTSGVVGTDSFSFVANDGLIDSNIATVSITIAEQPEAQDVSVPTSTGTSVSGSLVGENQDASSLTFTIVNQPANGVVSVNASGEFTYINTSGVSGSDSFGFTTTDELGLVSNVATVSLDVEVPAPGTSSAALPTPTNNPHALSNGVGAIPGAFSVSQSGKANYNVPLRMPPSIRGLAPSLAFSYTGQINDGILGVSWYFSGLAEITRCSTILERDNFIDGPNFDQSDRFCLNGEQLIAINGAYGADGTEYRTESETYARIVSNGGTGNHDPTSFTIQHATGFTETYGGAGNSVKTTSDGNQIAIWKISRKEDREGNAVNYSYIANAAAGTHYIDTITYAENSTQVKFVYQGRPDVTPSYRDSHLTVLDQRLSEVEFRINNSLIREYRLGYQISDITGRSQLASIQDCPISGGSAFCLPATTFEWGSFSNVVRFNSQGVDTDTSSISAGVTYNDQKYHVGDVNADGRDDLILTYRRDNALGRVLYLANSSGTGFGAPSAEEETGFFASVVPDEQQEFFTADVNGDGRTDLIYIARHQDEVFRNIFLANNTGTAFIDQGYQVDNDPEYLNIDLADFQVGDVNGDGRTDVVFLYANGTDFGRVVYLAEQSPSNNAVLSKVSSQVDTRFTASSYNNSRFLLGDVNGDGKADLVWTFTVSNFAFRALFLADAAGDRFYIVSIERDDQLFNSDDQVSQVTAQLGDLNGDSKADLIWTAIQGNNLIRSVYVSDEFGNHFKRVSEESDNLSNLSITSHENTATRLVDVNADGRQDLVYTYTQGDQFGWVSLTADLNGQGFSLSDSGTLGVTNAAQFENQQYMFADITSDGRSDLVWLYNNSTTLFQRVFTLPQAYPDHITKITDAFNTEMNITYGYLSDPDKNLYTRDNTAQYPLREDSGQSFVVERLTQSDGIGGLNTYDYRYAGARTHLRGRGFVGFREMTTIDQQYNFTTVETYAQEFPLIGSQLTSITRNSVGTIVNETYNHLRSADVVWAQGTTQFPHMIDSVSISNELNDGGEISTVLNVYQYDISTGNIDVSTRTTGYGFTGGIRDSYDPNAPYSNSDVSNRQLWITTTNGYDVDLGPNWRPGFLTTESVRYQGQDDTIGKTVVTQFTPRNATSFLPASETRFAGSGVMTRNVYGRDNFGNVTSITTTADGLSGSINETYGSYLNGLYPASYTNDLDHVERYQYDLRTGQTTEVTDANGLRSYTLYDDFGRAVVSQSNAGARTVSTYTLCGNACIANERYRVTTTTTHPSESVKGAPDQMVSYDQFDRELRSSTDGFDGRQILLTQSYDNRGRTTSRSEPYYSGDAEPPNTFVYDDFDRLTVESKADGSRISYVYQTNNSRPNERSQQTQDYFITTPTGNRTVTNQQWTNAVSQIARARDAENILTELRYDSQGNVAWSQVDGNAATQVTVETDVAGNKTRIVDPNAGELRFTYDGLARLLVQRHIGSGETITSTYDTLGRITSRVDAGGSLNRSATWTYDPAGALGQLQSMSDNQGYNKVYAYDAFTRPSVKITELNTEPGRAFVYTYDGFDRITNRQYPSGFAADYGYNGNGYHASISNAGDNSEIWTATEQDARNNYSNFDLGNGLASERRYNVNNGYLESATAGTNTSPTSIQNLSFAYDAAGNLHQRQRNIAGGNNTTENFTYDNLHRMRSSSISGLPSGNRSTSFSYNNLGNILTKSDVSDNNGYSYGANGAGPHAVTARTFAGSTVDYSYDTKGNMAGRGDQTLEFTVFNKPNLISGPGFTTNFEYSPNRQRYSQRHSSGGNLRETFYYENRSFEVVRQGDETREKSYVGDHFIHTKVTNSSGTSEEDRYLLRDHLNSLETITDENGAIVHRVGFDTHGRNVNTDGELVTDAELSAQTLATTTNGFTGHESLLDSGLIHMNGRVYDPIAGRFLSADPFVQFPHSSQAHNRYSYVLNNPVSYTDPSGEIVPLLWVGVTLAYRAYSAVDSVSSAVDDFQTLASDDASTSEKAASVFSLAANAVGVPKVVRDKAGKVFSTQKTKSNRKRNNRSNSQAEKPDSNGSDGNTEKSGGNKEKSTSDGGDEPPGGGGGSGGNGERPQADFIVTSNGIAVPKGARGGDDTVEVFRVFGGDARAQGFSFTTTDPRTVSNFRNAAGLPSGGASGSTNTADFLIKGEAKITDIIKSRSALPLDGNKGGLPELIIDPKNVDITDFSVLKP